MSIDLDDPLAGILSDGSDDSFFDDDIIGKKKPAKKKISTPIMEKKNSLFDLKEEENSAKSLQSRKDSLFDLGTESKKPPTQNDYDFIRPKIDAPNPSTPFSRTLSKESINTPILEPKNRPPLVKADSLKSPAKIISSSVGDKLNFTEPKKETLKPLERGKSFQSLSLLDDILGGPSTTATGPSVARPATAAKSQDFDLESILGKSESKVTIASNKTVSSTKTVVTQKPILEDDTPEEVTKTVKKSKASEDWLGLFQNKDDNEQKDEGMPAWLGGGDSKKKKTEKQEPVQIEKEKVEDSASKIEPKLAQQTQISEQFFPQFTSGVQSSTMLPLQGSNNDITTEGANLYLQQQESQLMLALQLKSQEEKLAAMQLRQKETQRVQREAALAHHSQLDSMLHRQAEQRQQMQALIASHQDRITQRIKALLGSTPENIDQDNEDQYEEDRAERKETPHMKEKKQLLQLVQSLQENHDKEIDLMETSYRRQLAFLEVSISQSEERMKDESDKLLKFYMEKISWLEEHHQLHKKLTEDNLNSLTQQHKIENDMLRQQHLDNIKGLQEHHATLMENIRTAVKQEQILIRDSATFSSDLHEIVTDVKENKSQCQILVETVQELVGRTQRDSDRSLQAREVQINEMMQQFRRERDNFESEKMESRDMVKMMENRLKQMTAMIEEDKASLKQKKMELEFERATFTKQTEYAKNILQKQDDEIKMMRTDIQKEYDEKITKINEEKAKALKDSAAIAKEKVSIQNLKDELEKTKAELQAQLEEIMEERSRLNLEKQQTHMEAQRIIAKSRDLELLAKNAIEKQTQADQKYAEAEFLQNKYEDRIRRMQEQAVSLNAREKSIAKEKVALSRERLSLHNERKQIENKMPCSLCKSQNMNVPYLEPSYNIDTFQMPVSRDYAQANMSSAMNAIENEMAYLISRNNNLKYSTGVGNVQLTDNVDKNNVTAGTQVAAGVYKDYMDPKFMMLRLDVQQVLSNLDNAKNDHAKEKEGE